MNLRSSLGTLAGIILLTACGTPVIDPSRVSNSKSVVIADFPDLRHIAIIAPVVPNWPKNFFTPMYDGFYKFGESVAAPPAGADTSHLTTHIVTTQILDLPKSVSLPQGVAMVAAGGIVGAFIETSAAETQKRAAAFPSLLQKAMPDLDMRADILQGIRLGLETKGIQVRIAPESRNLPMRLRWPTTLDKYAAELPPSDFANSPAVDADLLVQIAPIAGYAAPGPLNSYEPVAGICVAVFDGRTRQFLGWQAFYYKPPNSKFNFMTYSGLIEGLPTAGPALREALMSLLPQVTEAIAGKRL